MVYLQSMKNIIIIFLFAALSFTTYQLITLDNTIPSGIDPVVEEVVSTDVEKKRVPNEKICVGEGCDGSMSGDSESYTVVSVPLVTSTGNIGCGEGIVFSPHAVNKTSAVLDATYKKLFSLEHEPNVESDDVRNVVALEKDLFYKGVSIDNSKTARLLLEGKSTYIYNCTIPTFRAQIEQAALQFSTVDSLEVYINNKLWDWCDFSQADPEEDGCDINPKHWIATK